MEYDTAVRAIIEYFKKEDKIITTRKKIADLLGIEQKVAYKKYIRKMIGEGLLSVGPDFYMRNDDVYKLKSGKEMYIKRSANEMPISLDEWINYAENDNDIRIDGFAEATNPIGEHVRIENEGLSLWTEHSWGHKVWLDYRNGQIVVKNPDQETTMKMFEIAEKLKASVNSQGGEVYGEDGLRIVS